MRLSFFCCKQKTAYEMRISDWSSDVCSSDLARLALREAGQARELHAALGVHVGGVLLGIGGARQDDVGAVRAGIAGVALVADHSGRASCRERVGPHGEVPGVAAHLTKKDEEREERTTHICTIQAM